jgi:uncharacterized protein (DUF362 family)
MKRRDFIKSTTIAGASGVFGQGCTSMGKAAKTPGPKFDVHPFVKNHPEAVFIYRTAIKSKRDTDAIRESGYRLAKDLIVKHSTDGYPETTRIVIKPNWTGAGPEDGKPVYEKLGANTDPNFIGGWVQGMREAGPQQYYIRESGSPQLWKDMGYYRLAERNNIDLRDMSSMDIWEMKRGDLNYFDKPDGVVFRKAVYMAPVNEPDTFLVNIAKLKAHGMGITASIKNLQGLCPKRLKQFCTRYDKIRESYEKPYHKYFKKNLEKRIETLYAKHLNDGFPRWDKPGENGGIWMEQWCQRMLDSYSVIHPGISMVEGIYSQDGNGFGSGPHEKLGSYGITSRDYMSNIVVFGMDPFRVDIIIHWLGGHEPGNFGLFHIGIERGFSDVLDPHDIPVYLWEDGQATLTGLENLKRTPLVTYYLQKDYNEQKEPRFHLCDEPFDYTAYKAGKRVGDCTPSIRELGRDGKGRPAMEISVARREDVYVEVLNSRGEILWRLMADDLEPGNHQVVWDGFASPGIYNFYARGMGWDAERRIVVYS